MTAWSIEPREPLILRDGRPFNLQPGVQAISLPFPFPSVTAGAARNRAGSVEGVFARSGDELSDLKGLAVRGPLLMTQHVHEQWELLVPAPADALLLEIPERKEVRRKRLVPLQPVPGTLTQPLKDGQGRDLWLVGPVVPTGEKPAKGTPTFWHWRAFEQWLYATEALAALKQGSLVPLGELGIPSLTQESRLHVALEPGMMVSQEGALFETRGLEFTHSPGNLSQAQRLALWLDVASHKQHRIQPGLDTLGAERRLVHWSACHLAHSPDPFACPSDLKEIIKDQRACRVVLLTPAVFQQGWLPDYLLQERAGVQPELRAALVQRPQVVSGWDMEKGRNKPTRRLAPAGSVFFLRFPLDTPEEHLDAWIDQFWMQCISDNTQDRLDGFGLAVLGSCSREPVAMDWKEQS